VKQDFNFWKGLSNLEYLNLSRNPDHSFFEFVLDEVFHSLANLKVLCAILSKFVSDQFFSKLNDTHLCEVTGEMLAPLKSLQVL
jgi:hypothetical protein